MIDDTNRVGNNIRVLREHRGDSRENLGKAINVAYSTVASFENGIRTVNDEHIEKIAKKYGVSFDMIKAQTLTKELLVEYDAQVNNEIANELNKILFVGKVTSPLARKNDNFKQADEYFQRIINLDYMETMVRTSRELYYKSFKEDGILAGAANTIMMLLVEFLLIDINTDLTEKLSKGKLTNGEAYLYVKSINQSSSISRIKFINDTKAIFDECIRAISSENEGKVFAEYYIALKYMFCMVDNGRGYRENVEIGRIMMREFANFDNQLAKEVSTILDIE